MFANLLYDYLKVRLHTVKLGYNELDYNELGYSELPLITNR
jgi:hypothetical protein